MSLPKSSLITFLNSNGYIVRGTGQRGGAREGGGPALTHTLMDGAAGGKIALPAGASDGFFHAYGADLEAGHRLFVIERKSDVFRMHLDCDFKTILTDDALDTFAHIVHEAVASYFQGSESAERCVLCAVKCNAGAQARTHPGIHMLWPHSAVSETEALWVRAGVVHALNEKCGSWDEEWSTVIDVSVLTSSGLRMVGSDKCRTCPTCQGAFDNRPFCLSCSRVGKIPEFKVYWPHAILPLLDATAQQCLADAKLNLGYGAKLCSTRLSAGARVSSSFQVPEGAPLPSSLVPLRRKDLSGRFDDRTKILTDGCNDLPRQPKCSSKLISLSPPAASLLTNALQTYNPNYSRVEVKEVREWKNASKSNPTTTVLVKVSGFGSRFCINKGSDHTSQGIYFAVTPIGGIVQRCFSRKETERRSGLCSCFSSAPKPIFAALRDELFPNWQATKQTKRVFSKIDEDSRQEEQSSASAAVIAALPPRMVRSRATAPPGQFLAALEIPSLCG